MKLLLSLFVLAACSSNPYVLSEDGRKVKLVDTKPKKCELLGQVTGKNNIGSVESARNNALNLAGEMGANKLYIKEEVNNGKNWDVIAMAYRCDK